MVWPRFDLIAHLCDVENAMVTEIHFKKSDFMGYHHVRSVSEIGVKYH